MQSYTKDQSKRYMVKLNKLDKELNKTIDEPLRQYRKIKVDTSTDIQRFPSSE